MPLAHNLSPHFQELARHDSSKSLKRSRLYQTLKPKIEKLLSSIEVGSYAPQDSIKNEPKSSYRAVAWNVERGICLEGILHTLQKNPALCEADLLLAPETDLGMARSGNHNIAQKIAEQMGFHYFFGPSYLNLAKGCGAENDVDAENTLGLHGNAIFSRYPMKDFHLIPLKNNKDKMRGREKRLGHQHVLAATVCFPDQEVRVVCAHLDAHSSKRHRRDQMKTILAYLKKLPELPTLIGGDFNTTTYNSRHAAFAIFGFWVRVLMGVGYMIQHHYPAPDRLFERQLFDALTSDGFDYQSFNEPKACTLHYSVADLRQMKNLNEWIPQWCFRFLEWALKDHNGRCSFKLDWFAAKGLLPVLGSAKVIGDLRYQEAPVSDHDAIVVDFKIKKC